MRFALRRPISVLLVEDNPADVRLFEEGMRETKSPFNLAVVETGLDAVNYLFKKEKFATARRPDLIVLDLNLPGLNGHDVLRSIKADQSLRLIPVVVLTSSEASEDIQRSYDSGASSYMQKPVSLDENLSLARTIRDYWFNHALLPTTP